MACCNAVAHFPNYNSIAILRQRVDRCAIRKTDAHEQRWRQPPNVHSPAEFGGEQKFSSAWTARCSDHPPAGLLLMVKDALGLRLWDLIPSDIPILAGGIAIGLTGIGLVSLAAYGIIRAIGWAIDKSI